MNPKITLNVITLLAINKKKIHIIVRVRDVSTSNLEQYKTK